MRLSRLEAVRFGRLQDVSLGELGDGLNVVLGPNGAGKTSFTTLARYVLYGFPKRSSGEPDYESSAGKRLGRLVFADADGEWIVERTEGVHGGPIDVQTISGAERGDLVERVTQGVSRNEFRVVFGFGLQDMADIEAGSGSSGVLSRLYAARVGLDVSPQDVREGLEDMAATLFKPAGKNPTVNTALREIKSLKKRIRDLEFTATAYAEERARLVSLQSDLTLLRERREKTGARRSELEAYGLQLETLEDSIAAYESELRDNETERAAVARELEGIDVDETLLVAAPRIAALVDTVSGYREWLAGIERMKLQANRLQRDAQQALASVAVEESAALQVTRGPESAAGVQRHRDALGRAQVRVESALRALDDAKARASVASEERVARTTQRSSHVPSIVMASLGAISVAAGLVMGQWVAAALGGLVVLAAGVLVLLGRTRLAFTAPGTDFDAARQLAQAEVDAATQALDTARQQWESWAGDRGLRAAGNDPDTAAVLLSAVDDWQRALDQREGLLTESAEFEQRCDAFRDSLAALAGDRLPELATARRSDVPALAGRLREIERLAAAQRDRRDALMTSLENLERVRTSVESELSAARAAQSDLCERFKTPDLDSVRVRAMAVAAAADAEEADDAYVSLSRQVGELTGKLDEEGKDAEMAQARLELAGRQERLSQAVERYAVYASAATLIARTQSFHERARQPEVVRRAGEIFSEITLGRYERISIPPGGGEIVSYRGAESTPSSELSRGSQEQLYLALRIALVEQLDGVGEGLPVLMDDIFANFDAQRHEGAARAVAELARHRQVVFFTCHPEVADLFAAVDPSHTRLELARC